jgi:DNA-binding MarR family transcriptional regulator
VTDELPLERIIHIAAFRAALRAFLHRNERIAETWGLTPQRYLLLLMIEGAPDGSRRLSFTELARRLQLSRNTVTELCARAEEAGLVEREPAEHDARVVYLRLTADGHRRLYGAAADNEAERKHLVRAFEELVESFEAATRTDR